MRGLPIEEGIIYPRKGPRDPEVGPDAVLLLVPGLLRDFVAFTGARKVQEGTMALASLYLCQTPGVSPPPALAGPFIGAPQAILGVEKLIALGARRLWFLGWCGSLQPGLTVGHTVLPLSAIPEEGTSPHYPLGGARPGADPLMVEHLEQGLKGAGLPYRKGALWTTDAAYRETPAKVRSYSEQGVLAVEMEVSAILTVACFRGVQAAGLLLVSDELSSLRWRPHFGNPLLREVSAQASEVLWKAVTAATPARQEEVPGRI